MSQVLQLNTPVTRKPQRLPSRKAAKAINRQALTALGIGAVAITLTGLSLSHLAYGIKLVTTAPGWQSWAMAIGIDLGFVALELSQLTISDKLRKAVAKHARPAILGTLVGSACLNAFAFANGANGIVMQSAAVVMGVTVPALVYALTRVGAAIYIDAHDKR